MAEQHQSTSSSNATPSEAQIRKNKITMILLFFMFVAPILAAVYIYNTNSPDSYKTKNRGNLIRPAKQLKNIELQYVETGKPYKLADQEHQWLLVYVAAGACDQKCKRQLVVMRQTRLAQGGEFTRVNRLYVMLDKQTDLFMKEVKEYHPGLAIVTGSKSQTENLVFQFTLDDKKEVGRSQRIYIVDPIGNLMMYYEFDARASDIAKDLMRLLKASQMG